MAEVLRAYLEEVHGRSGMSRKWHLIDRLYRLATAQKASISAARLLLEKAIDLDLLGRIEALEQAAQQADRLRLKGEES
jgi:hypothetical protein